MFSVPMSIFINHKNTKTLFLLENLCRILSKILKHTSCDFKRNIRYTITLNQCKKRRRWSLCTMSSIVCVTELFQHHNNLLQPATQCRLSRIHKKLSYVVIRRHIGTKHEAFIQMSVLVVCQYCNKWWYTGEGGMWCTCKIFLLQNKYQSP